MMRILPALQDVIAEIERRSSDGVAFIRRAFDFNALKQGLTAKQVVLQSERPGDFATFRFGLLNELNPIGALGEAYVEEIVAGLWRLRRVFALEAIVYGRGFQMHSDPTDAVTYMFEKHEGALSHLLRYHTEKFA
jgi:hypothetical protein